MAATRDNGHFDDKLLDYGDDDDDYDDDKQTVIKCTAQSNKSISASILHKTTKFSCLYSLCQFCGVCKANSDYEADQAVQYSKSFNILQVWLRRR